MSIIDIMNKNIFNENIEKKPNIDDTNECLICYKNNISKNLCCCICNKSFCIDCCIALKSRLIAFYKPEDIKKPTDDILSNTEADLIDTKSRICVSYDCCYCRTENNINIDDFTLEETRKLYRYECVLSNKRNEAIGKYTNDFNNIISSQSNMLLHINRNLNEKDVIKYLINNVDNLKKENNKLKLLENEIQSRKDENKELKNTIEDYKRELRIIRDHRVDEITEYNKIVMKYREAQIFINTMANDFNNTIDAIHTMAKNKKYKDIKKYIDGFLDLHITFKGANIISK